MNIQNGTYKAMAIRWDSVDLPLRAGTPVNLAGMEANDGNAVGLIPQNITARPGLPEALVLIGGSVDLYEVEREYGKRLSTDAMLSMRGITFYGPHGDLVPASPVPTATETAPGTVKMAANVAEAAGEAPTAAEFKALLDALIDAGIMAPAAE